MRALLVAVGTRGDVQPAIALALELRKLGHGVRMCISPNFMDMARDLGIEAAPLGVEMRMPAGGAGAMPKLTPEELRKLRESMPDLIADQFKTLGSAVEGCDVILGANAHQYAAPSIAEYAGIGCVTAVYAPVAIPSFDLAPPPPPGGASAAREAPSGEAGLTEAEGIRRLWRNTAATWNERALGRINQNRAGLGLDPIRDVLDYVLTRPTWLAADAALAPAPAAQGREIVQTGAWVLADGRPLPARLKAFLASGNPPIYIGFGSMPVGIGTSRTLLGAVRALGRRLILSKGWADLEPVDDAPDCLVIGDIDHDAIFPKVAAVVHHGGAGTTAAAARAGVPQVIAPMFNDQFYWAMRIEALGLGASFPHASMTEAALAGALRAALSPDARDRAHAFAARMGREGARIAAERLAAEFGSSES